MADDELTALLDHVLAKEPGALEVLRDWLAERDRPLVVVSHAP